MSATNQQIPRLFYVEKSLFCLHFWRIVLLDIEFLVNNFFVSTLWMCHPTTFKPPLLPMISQPYSIAVPLHVMNHYFFLLLSWFSFFFFFCLCLPTICLWYVFIILGVHEASWICTLMLIKFRKFWAIISSNTLSSFLSLLFFYKFISLCIYVIFHRSQRHSSLFFHLFSLFFK